MKPPVKDTNRVASTFRKNYTVFQLERMQVVSGTDFPISGDAPLAYRAYERCDRCNYSQHICPGCGDHLHHGIDVCDECRKL